MFTRQAAMDRLAQLQLPRDGFWLIAGSAMLLHGLRQEAADLDLGCSRVLFDELSALLGTQPSPAGGLMVCIAPGIDAFEDEDPKPETTWVDGFQTVTLPALYAWKLRMNRPKDQPDIAKLREVLGIR